MLFGLCMFSTHYAIRPDELAREAEARGFESLWFPEHTHIPVDRLDPAGKPLPDMYWNSFDPFVALTAAAMATRKLKLGTGICLLIQRDPITTAKEVASLDVLSGGRFLFGIGAGWKEEEIRNHHVDFKSRFRRLREHVAVMKEIWTKDEPSFDGEFTSFKPMLAYPKPLQKPHPPIIIGGHGPKVIDRAVEYCDGWLPLTQFTPDVAGDIRRLHERAHAAGRDPKSLSTSMFMVPAERETIEKLENAGADRLIFGLPSEGRDKVLPLLDKYAGLIAEKAHAS